MLKLNLGGDDVGQAVYSVPMVFGHPSGSAYYEWNVGQDYVEGNQWQRSLAGSTGRGGRKRKRYELEERQQMAGIRSPDRPERSTKEKRAPGTYQSMNLQVDLGSSDLVSVILVPYPQCHPSYLTPFPYTPSLRSG